MLGKIFIVTALLVILGVPLAARLTRTAPPIPQDAQRLVVITPHVPQIRVELAEGFDRWHRREHGTPVLIDWRSPGAGTTEILKLLEAQYTAAAREGRFDFTDPKNPVAQPGTIAFDLMIGGGTFDHGRLKRGVTVTGVPGKGDEAVTIPMSTPAGFSQAELDAWFGENRIGAGNLYDPQQFWIGTALSGFGIVYNRDLFRELELPDPRRFRDLAHPSLQGLIVLADPRQSGSVATAIDAILNATLWDRARAEGWANELEAAFTNPQRKPWDEALPPERMPSVEAAFADAWNLLREITANTRAYTAAATRPPMDVSAGEAAAALSIDFYGRGQAQAVLSPGQDPRDGHVGYVDPPGEVYIDADPASLLRGGPNPELAKRFVAYSLSDEGQAIWQMFSLRSERGASNPMGPDGVRLGPARYELRRMPARRSMYERYASSFVDPVNPFELASDNRTAGWRSALGVMIGAFSVDNLSGQRRAWAALQRARAGSVPSDVLARMEAHFYAFPTTPVRTSEEPLPFTARTLRAIVAEWRAGSQAKLEVQYTTFFREQYEEVVRLEHEHASQHARSAGAPVGLQQPPPTGR